ncbi:Na+ dependent nucleoside transporter C-terminus-domain-containing protein [Xylariales sp. PMI_506]|nr:Na+ dependent nucleoside transporter C-terminus-domain-containing protein [Xylariales sp. PMI_506]
MTSNSRENLPLEGHNASPQVGVDANPDPALDYTQEHRHEHTHHFGPAATEKAKHDDDVMYSSNTVEESRRDILDTPAQDYTTHKLRQGSPVEKSVDEESGNVGAIEGDEGEKDNSVGGRVKRYWRTIRPFVPIVVWMVFTAWWIYGLVTVVVWHRTDGLGWLIPFLLYLAVSIRVLTLYVPMSFFWKPVRTVWKHTVFRGYEAIPKKLHQPIAAGVTLAVFLIGSMVPEETGENTRANRIVSLFGLAVMIFVLWATSRNRAAIPWHTVIGGMLTQFIIAVFVLRTKAGYDIFSFISNLASTLLGFAGDGTAFLTSTDVVALPWFLTGVIPAIIFFVSLVSLLFHSGLLQWAIVKFATFFYWTLRVSGAEAVVAAATPFIGQGESAMLIRPFIPHLTLAELHQVMACGFATISGSVLLAYISMGLNAQVLVSSCIMSIPASLAVSKMRYPETEETLTSGRVVVPDNEEHKAVNALHAFANGAWLGLKIAGMIVATLLCIIALIGLVNGFLTWWGKYWGLTDPDNFLTLQLILGYLLYPVAWLLGVPKQDLRTVGEIIGIKVISNEFVAFTQLSSTEGMTTRGKIIATYACCGFGNIGSLGNQIGVLSQIAPGRSGDVSRVAVSALIAGIIATLSSASIAGMLYTDAIGS